MSRAGYVEDHDYNHIDYINWRGQVKSAIHGKRGQAFLKDLLAVLDAMPEKRLIAGDLVRDGEVCAIAALGRARGIDMESIHPEDYNKIGEIFNIAAPLVREIEYLNDEVDYRLDISPEDRFIFMRYYVARQIEIVEKS